jgi:hypothetical protein
VSSIVGLMIISMTVLLLAILQFAAAQQQLAYKLTVSVPSHPFGASYVNIGIKTQNGYSGSISVSTAASSNKPSHTFDIPPNEGKSVQVCVYTGIGLLGKNCHTYAVTGHNMVISQSPPSP